MTLNQGCDTDAPAARPWFRLYVEAFQDVKLRGLSPAHRWLWMAILGIARQSCVSGSLLVAYGLPVL